MSLLNTPEDGQWGWNMLWIHTLNDFNVPIVKSNKSVLCWFVKTALEPSGNCMSHLLYKSVSLHFHVFRRFSL
jgi:hypothetical protein